MQDLIPGAVHGALAWLIFGLLEHLCLSVLPAWRESSLLLVPDGRVVALAGTLAAYTLIGAVAGAAAGAVAARLRRAGRFREPSPAPDLASLTLVAAWIPHLAAARGFSRSAYLGLAVAFLLLAVMLARILRPAGGASRLTALLAAPAPVSACLLAPLVFRDQMHVSALAVRVGQAAPMLKSGAAAAGTVVLILSLLAAPRFRQRRRPASWRSRLATAAALAVTLAAAGRLLDASAIGRLRAGPASALAAAPAGRAAPGGVLLLSLDAVRADHLSVYGYPYRTSPVLESLARQATVYENALAASDMSLGTHASLFTGNYPSRHGAWVGGAFPFGRPLPPSERTLAERLGEAGWARFASVANGYFLNAAYGLSRGFQLFDVPAADRLEMRSRLAAIGGGLAGGRLRVHRPASEVDAVLRAGIEASRAGGKRFFAFGNYMEAHAPYTPAPRFTGLFPGFDASLGARMGPFIVGEGTRQVFDSRERRHLVSMYDAAIASLDAELGRLFDGMRSLGVYDSSLIIVVADHGEMLGERGVFGHGAGLVEEVLRVPMIVKYPFQRAGRRVTAPVSQVDVVPTVLEVAGLRQDRSLDGMRLDEAERASGRVVLSEAPPARAAFDGTKLRVGSVTGPPEPPRADPAALDRLKSLGYVR